MLYVCIFTAFWCVVLFSTYKFKFPLQQCVNLSRFHFRFHVPREIWCIRIFEKRSLSQVLAGAKSPCSCIQASSERLNYHARRVWLHLQHLLGHGPWDFFSMFLAPQHFESCWRFLLSASSLRKYAWLLTRISKFNDVQRISFFKDFCCKSSQWLCTNVDIAFLAGSLVKSREMCQNISQIHEVGQRRCAWRIVCAAEQEEQAPECVCVWIPLGHTCKTRIMKWS